MEGIVYKITCGITDEVYYGSTNGPLKKRIRQHLSKKNKCASRQIIERGNYSVEIVDAIAVSNTSQIKELENKYVKENECINRNLPKLLTCKKCNCLIRNVETHERSYRHRNHDDRSNEEIYNAIAVMIDKLNLPN